MDTAKIRLLWTCAAVALATGLGSCGGGDGAAPAPEGRGSSAQVSRTPERDLALVVFPGPRGGEAQANAVQAAREESASNSPVLVDASAVPPVGGATAFFQLEGDYRQCGRMLPGVEYSLAWRFAPPASTRSEGSVISLDVAAIGAAESARLAIELDTGSAAVQRIDLASGWSTIVLPVDADVRLDQIVLRVAKGGAGEILVGNARVRELGGPTPPTVLFVTFDTSRADHFSAIRPDSVSRTPHFDRIASEGVLYTNCYSATNVTNPSHVSLMTGVSPRDSKIVDNHTPLHHSATTLAESFEAAGYQTYAVLSAFHLGHELSGLGQGFQRLDTTPDFARPGEETLRVARDWIEDAAGSPLFLWVHLFDPHAPYRLPDSKLRQLLEGRPDPYAGESHIRAPLRVEPAWVKNAGFKDPAFVTALYGGGVEYLDDLFGQLLENDRFDAATVVVTADHGEGLGERDVWWDHSGAFYPMLHVPLAIRDAEVEPGTVVTEPVENRGIARRLLELLELPAAGIEGPEIPLAPGVVPAERDRFAMAAHGGSASYSRGDWLLEMFLRERDVDSSGRIHALGSCYLYDTKLDPGCRKNLVAVEYERAKEMRARLIEWVEAAEITGMNPMNHDVDPRVLEKLASMGYSEGPEQMASWWAPEFHGAPKEGADGKSSEGEAAVPWVESPWNLGFTEPNGRELLEAAVAAEGGK
ncbi:Sulfatase [Planctomycetes bacterium Poly30]|uniref:Sulfatase n=1 Tax=Saltatorellus ferox TaxID=2528018 RepID=A0A518EN24_9BACT|nr:Sulfatase [Planctomycetes bacterium Poly30]